MGEHVHAGKGFTPGGASTRLATGGLFLATLLGWGLFVLFALIAAGTVAVAFIYLAVD